jgi:hypothetical protein
MMTKDMRGKPKSIIYSAVILIGAVWMYRFLNSGGWLTHHYQLNDPDSLNLIPVIFEPIAVLGVVAYWVWREPKRGQSSLLTLDSEREINRVQDRSDAHLARRVYEPSDE